MELMKPVRFDKMQSSKQKLKEQITVFWVGRNQNKNSIFFFSLQETSENHPMSLQFTSQLTFHLLGNYRRSHLFWRPGGRFPWWSAAPCLHSARRNKIEKYELEWTGKRCATSLFSHQLLSPLVSLKKITNGFKWGRRKDFTLFTEH